MWAKTAPGSTGGDAYPRFGMDSLIFFGNGEGEGETHRTTVDRDWCFFLGRVGRATATGDQITGHQKGD
ncbi:hypothetical protein myaer102_43690 [Microcystis viridis NIES-102]|uniref:Uncharacterized protein n=1 Tax=Microcystis viridis NIES-102 TaxID=213615 RepID=A0A3G9K0K1_MICVR|nr:hypothetical protein myaer102_43690 [Microcystis viridis NIES-102]